MIMKYRHKTHVFHCWRYLGKQHKPENHTNQKINFFLLNYEKTHRIEYRRETVQLKKIGPEEKFFIKKIGPQRINPNVFVNLLGDNLKQMKSLWGFKYILKHKAVNRLYGYVLFSFLFIAADSLLKRNRAEFD